MAEQDGEEHEAAQGVEDDDDEDDGEEHEAADGVEELRASM